MRDIGYIGHSGTGRDRDGTTATVAALKLTLTDAAGATINHHYQRRSGTVKATLTDAAGAVVPNSS